MMEARLLRRGVISQTSPRSLRDLIRWWRSIVLRQLAPLVILPGIRSMHLELAFQMSGVRDQPCQ
jgi:hypothetical protein